MCNLMPSQILASAQVAARASKCIVVFADDGLAINILIRMICQAALLKEINAPFKETLMPSQKDLEECVLCVDASYNVCHALTHLLHLYKHGFTPQKLLFVIVPVEWHNRIGNENLDSHGKKMDTIVSQFADLSNATLLYI